MDININMNDKSKVRNLASWPISYERINTPGDEYLKANSVIYINNAEIESQVQNGNKFFTGTGNGDHARLFIENPELREYLGFDNKSEGKTQFILDDEKCKQILEYKTFSVFKKHLEEDIVTNHEKAKIINYARKFKLNDYEKIQELEKVCQMKFNNE
jgi:hypothetical protein